MKLQKKLYLSLILPFFIIAPVIADEAPGGPSTSEQSNVSTPADPQAKYFDCHYLGSKNNQDLLAKVTRDGDKFYWSDSLGESGPLTILSDSTIMLEYSYLSKNNEKISGKMTFNVKPDRSLDGTYGDSVDSGKIICVEHQQPNQQTN